MKKSYIMSGILYAIMMCQNTGWAVDFKQPKNFSPISLSTEENRYEDGSLMSRGIFEFTNYNEPEVRPDNETTLLLSCPENVQLECGSDSDPAVTGFPIVSGDYAAMDYSDEVTSGNCPVVIIRHWSVTDLNGEVFLCDQTITIQDTQAPQIEAVTEINTFCGVQPDFQISVTDCDPQPAVSIVIADSTWNSAEPCLPGMYRTQTQGGWGAVPNGNNPGVYLHGHFDLAFPEGLTIGCNNTILFTSAQSITDFLPSGTTPSALPSGNMVNPGGSYQNVLAGQLVAATLNTGFDLFDPDFGSSEISTGELLIASGTFAGMTVNELLVIANQVIGGCSTSYSYAQVNEALTALNENFDNGTVNENYLDCGESECLLVISYVITATDNCGNSSSVSAVVNMNDLDAPVFPDVPVNITVNCEDLPIEPLEVTDNCGSSEVTLTYVDTEFSGYCYPVIERSYTATDFCGNTSTFTQYIAIIDTIAPVISGLPATISVDCGDEVPFALPLVTDNCDGDPMISYSDATESITCGELITRTWTATDHCGNTTFFKQYFTIADNEGPAFQGQTALTFECQAGEIPSPVATDGCGVVSVLEFTDDIEGNGCNRVITRTWYAEDNCGNQSVFTQVITVKDVTPPMFTHIPLSQTLPCGSVVPSSDAVAVDQCGAVNITQTDTMLLMHGNCPRLIRTFVATDECGNMAFASQTFDFTDVTPPVFMNLPADFSGQCGDVIPADVPYATDDCDVDVIVQMTDSIAISGCVKTIYRTWLAQDHCGNSASHVQILTLTDEESPIFNSQNEITIGCHMLSSLSVDVSDDCSEQVQLSFMDEFTGSGCNYDIQRQWLAIDDCGNQSVFEQLIHVTDSEAPVFSNVPGDVMVQCAYAGFESAPVAIDNCSGLITPQYEELQSGSGCEQYITRTWTATDECGNVAVATQVITIADTQAPVIHGLPSDTAFSCESYTYPEVPTTVFATDNCDAQPELLFNEVMVPGLCDGQFQIVRSWTAVDDCGNSATGQYVISVIDNTAPVFETFPADTSVVCGGLPAPFNMQASDACGGTVNIDFTEQAFSGGCPHLIRTWTASDNCGNSAVYVQHITIIDNEPPVMSGVPTQGPVSCNNIPPVPDPVVTDNCDDNVQVVYSETIIGTGCNFTMIRMWIAEDDCGNSAVVSQSINLVDDAPPVFVNAPDEITVNCSSVGGIAPPNVSDDCAGTVTTTFADQVVGSGCSYEIYRTYTATDLCGNAASMTQLIHVVDETSPVIIGVPLSTFTSCTQIPVPPTVVATDNCTQNLTVNFSQQINGAGCSFQIIRTWTAADACGNTAIASQVIYVNDNVAPIWSGVPADISISCDQPTPPLVHPVASDNCGAAVTVNHFAFTETADCGQILRRYWNATDQCGNTSSVMQTITITDTSAPVMSGLPQAQVQVSCGNIPAAPAVTASDNCSAAVITFNEQVITNGCPYVIQRTWSASDDCGNTSVFTQQISVSDNQPPQLTGVPQNANYSCGDVIGQALVTATDNCTGTLPVMFSETSTWSGCTETVTRTWTAQDLCGNVTAGTQVIQITDADAPQWISTPENLVVECDMIPVPQDMTAEDCNAVVIEWTDNIVETSCATEFEITRMYTATDACGNQSDLIQIIAVVDTTAPALSDFPQDLVVTCSEIPSIPVITATDNCGAAAEVVFHEDIITSQDNSCVLQTADSPFGDIALWLPGLSGMTINYVFDSNNGSMTRDDLNGTAHITGQVYNTVNPTQMWILDLYLVSKRDWTQWNALGRSYKDDLGFAGTNYIDWTYYELDPSSRLIGAGSLTGSVLNLTHAPTTYYYGFQVGMAANNRNAQYGMSGWFLYSGTVNGNNVNGHGDLITENDCCPEQQITRTWISQDCAGNVQVHTQIIDVVHDANSVQPDAMMATGGLQLEVMQGTREEFVIEFMIPESGEATIELIDMNGKKVDMIYRGQVEGNVRTRLTYPKSKLGNSFYLFELTDGNRQLIKPSLMIN